MDFNNVEKKKANASSLQQMEWRWLMCDMPTRWRYPSWYEIRKIGKVFVKVLLEQGQWSIRKALLFPHVLQRLNLQFFSKSTDRALWYELTQYTRKFVHKEYFWKLSLWYLGIANKNNT